LEVREEKCFNGRQKAMTVFCSLLLIDKRDPNQSSEVSYLRDVGLCLCLFMTRLILKQGTNK